MRISRQKSLHGEKRVHQDDVAGESAFLIYSSGLPLCNSYCGGLGRAARVCSSTHLALAAHSPSRSQLLRRLCLALHPRRQGELPGVGAIFVEEPATGLAVGLLREANDGDRALLKGLSAGIVVDVGSGETGADGVYRDLRIA